MNNRPLDKIQISNMTDFEMIKILKKLSETKKLTDKQKKAVKRIISFYFNCVD